MLNTKKSFWSWSILVVFFGVLAPGFAQASFDARYDNKQELSVQYEAGAAAKMTRGMTNVLFGWTEIGRTPAAMSAGIEHGAVTSFLFGVPYGIFRAVGRTGVGAYEMATFFAPQAPIMKNLQGDVS